MARFFICHSLAVLPYPEPVDAGIGDTVDLGEPRSALSENCPSSSCETCAGGAFALDDRDALAQALPQPRIEVHEQIALRHQLVVPSAAGTRLYRLVELRPFFIEARWSSRSLTLTDDPNRRLQLLKGSGPVHLHGE